MTEFDPLEIVNRFRSFLPVVVDVETGGFNYQTDALLEIAAVLLYIDRDGDLRLQLRDALLEHGNLVEEVGHAIRGTREWGGTATG